MARQRRIRVSDDERKRIERAHEILADDPQVPVGNTLGALADRFIEANKLHDKWYPTDS